MHRITQPSNPFPFNSPALNPPPFSVPYRLVCFNRPQCGGVQTVSQRLHCHGWQCYAWQAMFARFCT